MAEETKNFTMKDGNEAETRPETNTEKTAQAPPMPQMTFATFIISLNHSALVHLGVVEEPASGTKTKNLPLAKQTIDIISMLEEKTKGNLNEEEAEMIKSLLYDLRMIYVRETGT